MSLLFLILSYAKNCHFLIYVQCCILECLQGPNVALIVGSSLAGVALIGLLLLIIIKAIFYLKDLKEWRRFEKEAQRRQWAKVYCIFWVV